MKKEYTVKLRVIPKRGITYDRITVEIELPEEFKDWSLVPAFLYGYEASKYPDELLSVNLRRPK